MLSFLRGLLAYLWLPLVWFAAVAVACWWFACRVHAAPQDAVVRLPSHGASGTVIYSVPGRTLVLGCAHAFQGADRSKPITIDAPSPAPGAVIRPGISLVAVDYNADLSLVQLNTGPLPYVAPVARPGHKPGRCVSVGYDEMRLPPAVRSATLLGVSGNITWTREKPWHGRSGGALLDADYGVLIGVVSGYSEPSPSYRNPAGEVSPSGRGMYVSHTAILHFLGMDSGPPTVTERREQCPVGQPGKT